MAATKPKSLVTKPAEMTERQERVAELRLHGHTTRSIGKLIGVSHVTVVKDLAVITEIWKQRAAKSYDAHVAERLARIEQLTLKLQSGVDRGDWKSIDTAIRLEDRAARLLGIDKPVEQKVTVTIEMIDEEIARLERKALELDYIEGEIVE